MQTFLYAAVLTPDLHDGGYVVTFVDLPEAITQGDDLPDALHQAADCLEEAIAGRIRRGDPVPMASPLIVGQHAIPLPAQTAAKTALYLAMRESNLTQQELAARLQCDDEAVRRLLDPRVKSSLSALEAALSVLGNHLVLGVQSSQKEPVGV